MESKERGGAFVSRWPVLERVVSGKGVFVLSKGMNLGKVVHWGEGAVSSKKRNALSPFKGFRPVSEKQHKEELEKGKGREKSGPFNRKTAVRHVVRRVLEPHRSQKKHLSERRNYYRKKEER